VVAGSRYVEVDGLGHDYLPAAWRTWVDTWSAFAAGHR